MTTELEQGQQLADYRLDRRLAAGHPETWTAINEKTGDRACLHIWTSVPNDWDSLVSRVESRKGLVHSHINLLSSHGIAGDLGYLAEPWVAGSSQLDPGDDNAWRPLLQVLDAIRYAHRLNVVHGNLHPGNILVDSSNNAHITGFGIGLPPARGNPAYQSPQIKAGQRPEMDDDVFALGCLLFRHVTGKDWSAGVSLDRTLPERLNTLVLRMLSDSPRERNVDLDEVAEALQSHFSPNQSGIEATDFSKRKPSTSARTDQPQPPPMATRAGTGVSNRKVGAAAVIIIVLGLLLFYLLPKNGTHITESAAVPGQQTSQGGAGAAIPASLPTTAGPTPIERARQEHLKAEGEKVATEVFRLQVELEDSGIMLWGGAEFEAASQQLINAEAAFRESRFQQALDQYSAVRDSLLALKERIAGELENRISEGQIALTAGNAAEALTAFTIANALSPGDDAILGNLSRSENLPEVLNLVRQGQAMERDGKLDDALAYFTQARKLDSEWTPASQGIERMRTAIRERRFRAAMSEGFQAVSRRQYAEARDAFSRAAEIKPASTEPDEGLLQVDQAERNDTINVHRQIAQQHMDAERWEDAIAEFEAALRVTSTLAFARESIEIARQKLALTQTMSGFLADPTLLQSDDKLDEARSLLRDAARANFRSPGSVRQINTLAQLVSTARIEIPVTIISDGNTNVTVRRHAALGKITTQIVRLFPGRYTITGERQGYRDVREELTILAGDPAPVVTISSSERVAR